MRIFSKAVDFYSNFNYYIMGQYGYIKWKFVPLAANVVANVLIPVKILI